MNTILPIFAKWCSTIIQYYLFLRVDEKYLPRNFWANILILNRNFETVDENIFKWPDSELLLALKDNIVYC